MTKGWRLLLQLLILPVLYLASLPDPVLFTNVIFAIAFVTVPINGTVAGILIWSSKQAPEVETLRERADDAVTLLLMSLATSGTALLSILARLGFSFPGRPTLAVLSWLAILIAIPAVGWLRTWRTVWLPIIRRRLSPPDRDGDGSATQGSESLESVPVQVDRVTATAGTKIRQRDSDATSGADSYDPPAPVRPKRRS